MSGSQFREMTATFANSAAKGTVVSATDTLLNSTTVTLFGDNQILDMIVSPAPTAKFKITLQKNGADSYFVAFTGGMDPANGGRFKWEGPEMTPGQYKFQVANLAALGSNAGETVTFLVKWAAPIG